MEKPRRRRVLHVCIGVGVSQKVHLEVPHGVWDHAHDAHRARVGSSGRGIITPPPQSALNWRAQERCQETLLKLLPPGI